MYYYVWTSGDKKLSITAKKRIEQAIKTNETIQVSSIST